MPAGTPVPEIKPRSGFMEMLHHLGMDLLLLLKIMIILAAAWLVERLIYFALRRGYAKAKAQGREEMTRYRFLRNAVRTVVVISAGLAIVYTVPSLRSFAFTLFAGAGLLVAILGFAAQKAFSDIISGIFIVAFKPFRVGDVIQTGTGADGISGTVEDINLRHTTLLTSENRRAVVPNSIIGEERIINSSIRDEATCEFVEMPVSYEADLDLAMHILATECVAHPLRLDRRMPEEKAAGHPIVAVRLVRVQDGVCLLRAYVWARDPVNARVMHYELNKRIVQRFVRERVPLAVSARVVLPAPALPPSMPVPHGAQTQR